MDYGRDRRRGRRGERISVGGELGKRDRLTKAFMESLRKEFDRGYD